MQTTTFRGRVTDEHDRPIRNAEIEYFLPGKPIQHRTWSNADGRFELPVEHEDDKQREHELHCSAFGLREKQPAQPGHIDFRFKLGLALLYSGHLAVVDHVPTVAAGSTLVMNVDSIDAIRPYTGVVWSVPEDARLTEREGNEIEVVFERTGPGRRIEAIAQDLTQNSRSEYARVTLAQTININAPEVHSIAGNVGVHGDIGMRGNIGVTLHRTATHATLDQALWVAIRNRTHAVSFNRYRDYMNRVLHGAEALPANRARELDTPRGVDAYRALKYATEAFLLHEGGVFIRGGERHDGIDPHEEESRLGERYTRDQMEDRLREYLGDPPRLPYIKRIINDAFPWLEREGQVRDPVLLERIDQPLLIELIHTYWLEEGMLMQTMNAVSQRFQNVRSTSERDPLANLELDPLRRLNNWLWGFTQDELNRLTVRRRAFEYLHHYGLPLYGKAVPGLQPADNRSKFLEAFHNLLYQCSVFFKEDFQTTIIADGYPLLNSLKEVHLILAQGACNQFGDLPWTARVETLLVQFMLSQPAIHDFLQSRTMVPYKEAWMPQVDAMKTLQGWSDVTVTHFRDLADYGEQILLAIRYGDWINVNNEDSARTFGRYFRSEIQGYLHAYRAVTGVDLTKSGKVDATIPAVHLQTRLAAQQRAR
jgi:hypothetical protein